METRTRRVRMIPPTTAKRDTPSTLAELAPGVSLRKLSKRTGIALPHLSRVFNRKRGLSMTTARKIATATGTTIDRVAQVLAA